METNSFELIPFGDAFKELSALLSVNVRNPTELMTRLENKTNQWRSLDNWENLTDLEILKKLKKNQTSSGKIYAISEASYRKDLVVFSLPESKLEDFAANHLVNFGEYFFNGDVFIFNVEQRIIWVFHHEGMCAFFDMNNI